MPSISLINLTKRYENGNTAVDKLNLSIEGKEFIMLVGPSGCGKSTTLRMIAGLEDISEGELWIRNRLMNNVEPGKRNMSMVFQNYALYPYMSVYDNIAFGLRAKGMKKSEADRRVREAAEMLQIDSLLMRRPSALSGGQKQRVAIGAAIVQDSEAYLFDEPLSNLDAKLRGKMRVEIAQMFSRLNSTMIYVTHDQTEAMTLATRIVVMNKGVVQQIAAPEEIYNRPANKFVAGFIGSPQMNFLQGIVEVDDGNAVLKGRDFKLQLPKEVLRILESRGLVNRKVELGIRPEHFIQGGSTEEINQFRMRTELCENLGSEKLLHGRIGGTDACVRMKNDASYAFEKGDMIFSVDIKNIHIFDVDTGNSLFHGTNLISLAAFAAAWVQRMSRLNIGEGNV